MMRSLKLLLLAAVVLGMDLSAQPVPPEYQDLYDELSANLTSFQTTLHNSWDGSTPPVALSANLLSANSSLGPVLLGPTQRTSVLLELDGLKALGVTAVSLDISFPVLYRPFYQTQGEYDQYLNFYTQLAQDVRARGLKLVVENQVIFTEPGYGNPDVAAFYAGLTLEQYQQGRMEVARTIAQAMAPDYLSVIQEPDTEATQSGKPEVGTVEGSTALLNVILSGLQAAGIQGVAVGAGVGTWQADYLLYVQSYASTAIDFIDMHVFPVNRDYLSRALEIADTARSYGKRVGMTETWLFKIRESELDVLSFPTVFGRDVFSFWEPLDALHLRNMVELAHYKGLEFMSPFWSGYFRAYLDYSDENKGLSPETLQALVQSAQSDNFMSGVYTTLGLSYKDELVSPPDVTPPSSPPNLSAQLTSPASVFVSWSGAPDNVGTAAYQIFRNDEMVAQTATGYFSESALGDGQTYGYSVVALDASGNASPAASVSVTTPDKTAPSIPADFAGAAVLSGSDITISLSWSPSTDNVAVTQYIVYRGTAPASLSIIGTSSTTSFSIATAPPVTTYYFAVAAFDAAWNISAQSAVISLTTPSVPDVTPPTVRVNYPADGATLSRNTYLYAIAYDTRGSVYEVPSKEAGVQFFIDGVAAGPEQTVAYLGNSQYSVYRMQFDTRMLPNGSHVITALARDNAGNVATSAGVTVTFNNK